MARDALRDVFPVNVDFVDGEQPSSPKFDGWAGQTNNGMAFLAGVIGDVWGDEFGSNKLYPHRARPGNIANIARLLGPASALNPCRQARQLLNVTINPAVDIPAAVNEFQLPVVPIEFYGGVSSDADKALHRPDSGAGAGTIQALLTTLDPAVFNPAGRKLTKDAISAAGDWYIDNVGRVYTFTQTSAYGAAALQYRAQMHWEFHDRQGLNVYPDWQETTTYCSVSETGAGSGVYNIDLPMVTILPRERNIAYGSNQWEPGDTEPTDSLAYAPPEDYQAYFPYSLLATLTPGDPIPEGFMQLWDDTTGQVIDNLSFTLQTASRVTCTGAALSAAAAFPGSDSTRYRLVTVGTTITESLQELAWKVDNHRHNDKVLGGSPILHKDLSLNHIEPATVGATWGTVITSAPSAIDGNDHPQYLNRYGWQLGVDDGNYDGAMLGDIFMAAGHADYTANAYNNGLATSHAVMFGTTGSYVDADTAGVYGMNLHMKGENDCIWFEADNLILGTPAGGGVDRLNMLWSETLANTGILQWNSPTRNETGFAFLQSGAVVNAQTQMGQLWVHHENAAIDVGPPAPTGGAVNAYARLWCGDPDSGSPTTAEATLRLYSYSGGADRWCGIGMSGLSGIVATGTADLYLNSDQDLFLWADAATGEIDMVSQNVDMNINNDIVADAGRYITMTAADTANFRATANDVNLVADNGYVKAFTDQGAGFEVREDDGFNSYVSIRTTDGAGNDYSQINMYGDGGEYLKLFHDVTALLPRTGFQCNGVGDGWGFHWVSFDWISLPSHGDNEAAMDAAGAPDGSMYYESGTDKIRVKINGHWRTLDWSP
jgi:hypothetical protein